MKKLGAPAIGLLIFLGLFLMSTVYTVKETERAILLRLGEMVESDLKPGLHFKIPGYHSVRKFDGRVLAYEIPVERYTTSEKKALLVETFVAWRIIKGNVGDFFTATRGNEERAGSLLMNIISKKLRDEFGKRTIKDVVSGERDKISQTLVTSANLEAKQMGIEIVDARVKRIDLPLEVSQSVYARMETARKKEAANLRSDGEKNAKATKAKADSDKTILVAEANKMAEILRGEGDAKAAETYANAYKLNPEFYSFYRRLEAYRNSLKSEQDIMVLKSDNEFFKYFKQSKP